MMKSLLARRTDAGWTACLSAEPCPDAPGLPQASVAGRTRAWELARQVGLSRSPWALEYQKAALGSPEITLGYAHLLAQGCEASAASQLGLAVPAVYASARAANRVLACRGLAQRRLLRAQGWLDQLRFGVASLAALASLAAYALARGRSGEAPPPPRGGTAFALHGERSTRTQHLLKVLGEARPDCILVIGRLRASTEEVRRDWASAGTEVPPLVHPFSLRAACRAVPAMLRLLAEGWRDAPERHYLPPLREHVAIAFRVLLGAAMRQWWKDHGFAPRTVLFGHTGTADVAQLESALQEDGVRTVHAVHGLATGPNFTGFSDEAWFRCGYDARQYAPLGGYGRCLVQEAAAPEPVRGSGGIYLLTNLAHPMNPAFVARGPEDEIALLRLVAEAARLACPEGQRMVWRPHPVLRRLPVEVRERVRAEARRLGFEEQDPAAPMAASAAQARWVITSPSTTAVDLLSQGTLSIVVDLQQSAAGTATACFPGCAAQAPALAAMMRELGDDAVYRARFLHTWDQVRPAATLRFPTGH
jgi:hypothetical protein